MELGTTILSEHYQRSLKVQKLCQQIENTKTQASTIGVNGLIGSALSFVMAEVFKKSDVPILLIFDHKEEAAYYLNDLELLLDQDQVLFYPGSYRRPYQIEETDNANV